MVTLDRRPVRLGILPCPRVNRFFRFSTAWPRLRPNTTNLRCSRVAISRSHLRGQFFRNFRLSPTHASNGLRSKPASGRVSSHTFRHTHCSSRVFLWSYLGDFRQFWAGLLLHFCVMKYLALAVLLAAMQTSPRVPRKAPDSPASTVRIETVLLAPA
jgi:hypothetical protein